MAQFDSPSARIRCLRGDITEQDVDAIVNAANSGLRGGGGVDGAIHRVAGPGLLAECVERHPDGCPTGEVRLTGGHGLRARHVIHAVGPVWRGGSEGEAELLAGCYRSALEVAAAAEVSTLAFPAISCGAYGYPLEAAARIALGTVAEGLQAHASLTEVRMVLFDEDLRALFESARRELAAH